MIAYVKNHRVMSTIAEFYARNPATEVVEGLTQKGSDRRHTLRGRPVGDLKIHVRNEQGGSCALCRSTPDRDRAELVRRAFQGYATGNWTLSQLQDELVARGLAPTDA